MKRYARRDGNHSAVVSVYRDLGCSVADTADLGGDFPDLVVGVAGVTDLVEIKHERGKLKPGQAEFASSWHGSPVVIVRTLEDVVIHVGNMRKRAGNAVR